MSIAQVHNRKPLEPAARRSLPVVTEQRQYMLSTVFHWNVLAVPATSAAPESMFSVTGNIMKEKRARFNWDHLEELMYVH